ncbi:hypothetical protein B0H21DRAFT_891343 [Amylocystis lapponica]|nr:hypothetical protein B0H21DRAFT_891343 [Amylocystis lapponica]
MPRPISRLTHPEAQIGRDGPNLRQDPTAPNELDHAAGDVLRRKRAAAHRQARQRLTQGPPRHVLDDAHRVWYEDLSGSGSETMAHLRENGCITVMFSAFEGAPRVLRLWGIGAPPSPPLRMVHELGTPEYEALVPPTTRLPGSRCAVVVDVHRIGLVRPPSLPLSRSAPVLIDDLQSGSRASSAATRPLETGDDAVRSEQGMKAYWARENRKTPVHVLRSAEENGFLVADKGQDSEKARAGGVAVSVEFEGVRSAEMMRLVAAFSLGLAVAAVYVNVVAVPLQM